MISRWRKTSLRIHLLILVAVTMGIILAAFLTISSQALNDRSEEALDERLVLAKLMAAHIDTQLQHARTMLQSALSSELLDLGDGNLAPESRLLQGLYEHTVIFKRINLLDISGNVILTEPYEEYMVGENLSGPPYNFPLSQNMEPFFFTSIGFRSKKPGTAIIFPIHTKDGGISGYLYGWLDFTNPRAASLLSPYTFGSGYTDLIDHNGMVLFSADEQRQGQVDENAGMVNHLIENNQFAVGACSSCHSLPENQQVDNILAFAPLSIASWGVALYQPKAEVFATTYILAYRLVALGLVVLVVLSFGSRFIIKSIVHPLQELTSSCQRIAEGDLLHPVPGSGVAETLSLGRSFEEMRTALVKYRDEMEAARRDLEDRVAERTSELVQYRDYLIRANENLNTLNSMAAVLVHSLDLDETLDNAVNQILEVMPADVAGIYLLDERESTLVLAAQHGLPDEVLPVVQRLGRSEAVGSKDGKASPDGNPNWSAECRKFLIDLLGLSSFACISLHARGATPGSLFVGSRAENRFSPEEIRLLEAVGWQIAMAVYNAQLFHHAQCREQERAEMLRMAINAQEDERKRVARELHDETSQALATLLLGLDTLENAMAADPKEAAQLQGSIKGIARQMLENIKRITTDLRPSLLDDLGLIPAVSWYGEKRMKPLGITLQIDESGLDGSRLPAEVEIALFRIIQEALTNVIRHANATQVTVSLERTETEVHLCVADNGCGFALPINQPVDYSTQGQGLRGVRERAALLGGEFHLDTLPGQGTVIIVRLPLFE